MWEAGMEVGGLLVESAGSELQASAEAREDIAGICDGAHPGGSTQEPEEEAAGATLHPQVGMPEQRWHKICPEKFHLSSWLILSNPMVPHDVPSFLSHYFSSTMTEQSMYSSFHSVNTKSIEGLLWARQLLGVKQWVPSHFSPNYPLSFPPPQAADATGTEPCQSLWAHLAGPPVPHQKLS